MKRGRKKEGKNQGNKKEKREKGNLFFCSPLKNGDKIR